MQQRRPLPSPSLLPQGRPCRTLRGQLASARQTRPRPLQFEGQARTPTGHLVRAWTPPSLLLCFPADRHNRAPARSRRKNARSRAAESAQGWVPRRRRPPRLRAPPAPLGLRQQGAISTRNRKEHQQTETDVTSGREIEAVGLVRSEGRSKRRVCRAVSDLRGGGRRLRRYDCGHRAPKVSGTLNGTRRRRRASLADDKMSPRACRGRVRCRRRLSQR